MLFKALDGREFNLFINEYRINWDKHSASKFQFRVKQFFRTFWSNLEWFEEVPAVGDLNQLRFDFMCRFKNQWGETKVILVEADGTATHLVRNMHFHPTDESYIASMERDTCKYLYCKCNKIPLLRIYEDDSLTLDWFLETFGNILPTGTKNAK